jgi:hypothetical protein
LLLFVEHNEADEIRTIERVQLARLPRNGSVPEFAGDA